MRTSTDHGKIQLGLVLAIALAMVCLAIGYFRISSPSKPQLTFPKSQVSSSTSQVPRLDLAQSQKTPGAEASRAQAKKEAKEGIRQESDRERMEELEREMEEEREAYDKPDEGAQYLLERRLPEGEKALRFELYLTAMEQMRDLPQYSTTQRTLLPSLREMAQESSQSTGSQALSPSGLLGWSSLGPGNVGGRTRALLIHPRTPDTMFAGAASGGVWRTTDGGRNWTPLTDLLPNLAVNALAFDPSTPDTIYAGTGEGFFNADATRGAGIFRSFDGGNSWRRLDGTGTKDFYYVNDIVVSKANYNRVYAATASGVMRSVDGGVTWSRVVNEESNGGCSDLAIRTDSTTDVVFAACGIPKIVKAPGSVQASIYRNDNAGALGQWEVVYTEEGMSRTSLAIAPSNQNVVYAVSSENGLRGAAHSLHAVFRSTNSGVSGSWIKVNDGSANKLNATLFTNPYFAFLKECRPGEVTDLFYHQGWYDNTIAVDPVNENIVWIGGVDLFRSDDGGANWGMASFWQDRKTSPRYVHADQHVIAFHPQFNNATNRMMFVGTDGGIFRTENARLQTVTGNRAPCSPELSRISWSSLNNGYAVTQFYHGAVFPGGQSYLGGTQDNGVIFGSDDLGPNNWIELLSGDGGYVAIDPYAPGNVYAENTYLSLKKSTDGGKNFVQATTGISNIGFEFIAPLAMDPSDPTRLWLGGGSLWRTRNGAENWSQASAPLKGSATSIAVAQTDANFVLAGTNQGYVHRTTIGLNSNADTDWPAVRLRTGTNLTVSSVAFDPTNRDIAYATISNFGGKHVFRSVNGGLSWVAIDGGGITTGTTPAAALPDIPVNCIVVDPTDPQRLYIGTDMGVFTSPDSGMTWAIENTGFANVPVEWLTINTYKGAAYLFAFTRGRGAWRVPLGQVCTSELSPKSQTFDSTGGRGSITVTVSNGNCEWTVESKMDWLTITSGLVMRGNGTVIFNVAPSPDRKPRTGTVTIAGHSFTVTQAGEATCVSAATLAQGPIAPASIVAAFGDGLAETTQIPTGNQLPLTLAGVSITVKDYSGTVRQAPIFFVSPYQINFLIPADTAIGQALVTIYNGKDKVFNSRIEIGQVSPGFFTADGSGKGVPVGQALRIKPNSQPQSEPLSMMDSTQTRIIARPIDLGPELGNDSDRVFLVLFGTGIRFNSSVSATIGGFNAPVLFAGAQNDFAGLDQINVEIPRNLVGRGVVELLLLVDGQRANPVHISIK
jgi:uncharacterized protein (TIGR03437 family)